MKIKILDTNFLNENKDIPEIFDEEIQEYINVLEENNIEYIYGNICPDCEQFHREEDLTYIEDKNYYVCYNCLTDSGNYFYCDDCNNWYSTDTNSYETDDRRIICQDCANEHYVECADCGVMVHEQDCYYCEECDRYYCYRCWDDHYHEEDDDGLYEYHSFNDWQPQQTSNEPTPEFYIGHELEMDYGSSRRDAINLISSRLNGICMHDGSLSDDAGLEFISHPLSYNYMLSQEENYREVFKILTQDYGYKSHNTDDCGLHFHVTRPQKEEVIDRIILFMETYKEEIIKLSRRTSSEISDWCKFLSDRLYETKEKQLKSLYYIKQHKETSHRYMALNLTNYKTIEFRIFKGTLKYETFMADFEFVYYLTTLASDLSLPIEELTWERVVNNGRFLQNYCNEHELHTDKPIVDYTQDFLIEANRVKDEYRHELDEVTREVFKRVKNKFSLRKNQRINYNNMRNLIDKVYYTNNILDRIRTISDKLEYVDILESDDIETIKYNFRNIKEMLEREMI